MTKRVPDTLLADLDALKARAAADPAIATSTSRVRRLGSVIFLLKAAAADCPPAQLRDLATYLHADTIGHPDQDDTVLGRAKTGRYRRHHPGRPLTAASQRHLMDGLADLNRAAGHPPYWWQERGRRPWSKHTEDPIDNPGHLVLRRALCQPVEPRREPFRLRTLLALELLWDTGVPPQGLVLADTTDLAPDLSSIRLAVNPPGRTAATVQTFPLTPNARAALALWLPVRRAVVAEHLSAGPDAAANQALFITLRVTTGTYDDGRERLVPPGLRITTLGLQASWSSWSRQLNALHEGVVGWPVPTSLQQVGRGGATNRSSHR
jgi:hypothetical protein